jgi:malate dehydrogenase (oxaloacetate-decarboxylating)(NADP+)
MTSCNDLNWKNIPEEMPKGMDLLNDPILNEGTGFSAHDREELGLLGLLPSKVLSIEDQERRILRHFRAKKDPLQKYVYLMGLQDRNKTLFYRVVINNLDEMMPIIYTPTVGLACQQFGDIYQRPRGLYISASDKGKIGTILSNWPRDEVRIIVVTDGERILGLGDLGANGMGIPVGKTALYSACGGIPPSATLPVTLDVGTNNEHLLYDDPFYLGEKRRRLRGEGYDELLEEFMVETHKRFPCALIQFEDFANRNAFRLLEKYRSQYCCFNDDIQGTAAVAVAGIFSAMHIKSELLKDQKFLFLGAGEAGIGIADLLVAALGQEGVPVEEARKLCWFFDSKGMVVQSRKDLSSHKQRYAHDHPGMRSFSKAVKELKPTGIIGVSGQAQTFTRTVIEAMAKINERPIIFPLSNPTSKAECTAKQAYTWSEDRAIFASGSPFAPVHTEAMTHIPSQGNNVYIFPGVGLGAIAVGIKEVTDEMFMVAARTLASRVGQESLEKGLIFPSLSEIREVSARIATAVAEEAYSKGLASLDPKPKDMLQHMRELQFQPIYKIFR